MEFAYLGEPTQPPRVAPAARGPPDGEEDFDTREGDTFALSERAASESQGQGVALLGARRTQQQDVAGQSRDGCFTLVGAVPLQTILPAKVT